MNEKHAKILKSQTINLAGTCELDEIVTADCKGADATRPPKKKQQADAEKIEPKAEVVGAEEGFLILEISCSCGEKIQLRCATDQANK